jgi:hypothetical protein
MYTQKYRYKSNNSENHPATEHVRKDDNDGRGFGSTLVINTNSGVI